MVTREIESCDLDFGIETMTRPPRAPGRLRRAGGYRVMRPTNRGPVCVARVQSHDVAAKLARANDWIEEVTA
jgi:hypothetical protein